MAHIKKYIAFAVMAVAATSTFAQAQEKLESPAASDEVSEQDAALNAAFKEASSRLTSEGRKQLLDDQRQWLRRRNSECGLLASDTTSSQWPRNLSTTKAQCVVHASKARTSELNGPPNAAKPSLDGFTDNSMLVHVDEFTLPMGHSSGKWYAEVLVNRDIVENAAKVGFHAGVDNVNGYYAIEFANTRLPPDQKVEVIGFMVDLDNRLFDWRTYSDNFSGRGVPMSVNEKPYSIKLKGSRDLEYWLSRGHVRINYGQSPFRYPMPAGFAPWYYNPVKDDPALWIVPPYERVGQGSIKQTASAFWEWLLNRGGSPNPTLDRTGAQCAVNQRGELWFLAGAQALDRIERTCTVPFGVNLVLPAVALLLPTDDEETCKSTIDVARLSPYTIQDSFVEIDGLRFDRLQDYSASSYGCAPLTAGGHTLAKYANWLGLWVTLRPLPRGAHTVSFGGKANALKTDRQVTYKLIVQ